MKFCKQAHIISTFFLISKLTFVVAEISILFLQCSVITPVC